MSAETQPALHDTFKDAFASAVDPQEAGLMVAGAQIARYIAAMDFKREDGSAVDALSLKPEILAVQDAYPRLKFAVDKDRLDDAIDMLKAIDMRSPSMPGLTFNQLVCCNESTCMIVINAGASLVCEFAAEIAKRMPDEAAKCNIAAPSIHARPA